MNDITIPSAAIEAGARAIHARYGFTSWEDLGAAEEALECARAACLAMLAAWPGMDHMTSGAPDAVDCIYLPLPQEASDEDRLEPKPDFFEVSEKHGPVYAAIVEVWGERCPDFAEGCLCCKAWADYDARRGAAVQWSPIAPQGEMGVPEMQDILVCGDSRIGVGWLSEDRWYWVGGERIDNVTHWMLLPPPPSGEPRDDQ